MSAKASSGPATQPIGVFVLDDQEIVRRGVRALLEAEPDIRVIGKAGTASSALARIPALRPDVAVLDVRLPDGDGVSVCREIRSRLPTVACLMFTAFSNDQALLDSIMAGAAGYVLKQVRGCDLVGAVRTAASGQSLLNSRAASFTVAQARLVPLIGGGLLVSASVQAYSDGDHPRPGRGRPAGLGAGPVGSARYQALPGILPELEGRRRLRPACAAVGGNRAWRPGPGAGCRHHADPPGSTSAR